VTVAFLMKFYSVHIAVKVISAARLVLCLFMSFVDYFVDVPLSQSPEKNRYTHTLSTLFFRALRWIPVCTPSYDYMIKQI